MPEETKLDAKGKAFLKKAFGGRSKLVGSRPLTFGGETLAYGGAWGGLESKLAIPADATFEVLERAEDGATLLLVQGRSLAEAATLAPLAWDQFGYRLHLVGASSPAAASALDSGSRGVFHAADGADVFVHEFKPERRMLAFSLQDQAKSVLGLLLGDDKSLAPFSPPPTGCPVLRALLSAYAERAGAKAETALGNPAVAEKLQHSHTTDKKLRGARGTQHSERALEWNLSQLARLLEDVEGFSSAGAEIRGLPVRLVRGMEWAKPIHALRARLLEAELAAHPKPSGDLRFAYSQLSRGAAGPELTPVEHELLDLGHRAGRTGRTWVGPGVFQATGIGVVRLWSEACELGSVFAQCAELAGCIVAWSQWPDVAAAKAKLDAISAVQPPLSEYLLHLTRE